MISGKRIAPHETFEVHELISFKNVCAAKSATMAEMVQDQDLKSILQQDSTISQGHIQELQNLLQTSEYALPSSPEYSH